MLMEEEFIKACYDVSKSKNTLHDAWSGDHLGFYSVLVLSTGLARQALEVTQPLDI